MKTKKILFLHGFYASGQCALASTLKECFSGKADVLTPDLPLHPKDAIEFIKRLCDKEKPDMIVGNSCGAFYAQMLATIVGVPALLGNPHFEMTEFLKTRIGENEYKSPRKDGNQHFVIDEALISEFADVECIQFDYCNPYYTERIWGLFGEKDVVAHYEPVFLQHYSHSFHFPGNHTPSAEEVREWYVPLVERMLDKYPLSEDRTRFFQHFKGCKYRFIGTAYDSETQERMVVYEALYGDMLKWVRPEKMFFENIERDGRRFARFIEIDAPNL